MTLSHPKNQSILLRIANGNPQKDRFANSIQLPEVLVDQFF
jgi:hypothetical protein